MPGKETLAAFNATMNGLCAILLVSGYVMIHRRNIRAHATFMILALIVSAIFLASYLYSQFAYGDRTIGLKPSPLRTFYLILLASHVLLAIGMLPAIVVTVWRAAHLRFIEHRRIARPTFFVWTYVSVTGVIVYWMLYHMFPSVR